MADLINFIALLNGKFDNKEQFDKIYKTNPQFPYAKHVNTVCNEKINNLPEDFEGVFMIEESYYSVEGKIHSSSHLFLFTEEKDAIKLISYEIPEGYQKHGNTWEGGSISMFSPVLKFTLHEKFNAKKLEVSETMEINGRRTFGYDEPIIYQRLQE